MGYGFADCLGAGGEVVALEAASRTVPKYGLCAFDGVCELLGADWTCVESFVLCWDCFGREYFYLGSVVDCEGLEVVAGAAYAVFS